MFDGVSPPLLLLLLVDKSLKDSSCTEIYERQGGLMIVVRVFSVTSCIVRLRPN